MSILNTTDQIWIIFTDLVMLMISVDNNIMWVWFELWNIIIGNSMMDLDDG